MYCNSIEKKWCWHFQFTVAYCCVLYRYCWRVPVGHELTVWRAPQRQGLWCTPWTRGWGTSAPPAPAQVSGACLGHVVQDIFTTFKCSGICCTLWKRGSGLSASTELRHLDPSRDTWLRDICTTCTSSGIWWMRAYWFRDICTTCTSSGTWCMLFCSGTSAQPAPAKVQYLVHGYFLVQGHLHHLHILRYLLHFMEIWLRIICINCTCSGTYVEHSRDTCLRDI